MHLRRQMPGPSDTVDKCGKLCESRRLYKVGVSQQPRVTTRQIRLAQRTELQLRCLPDSPPSRASEEPRRLAPRLPAIQVEDGGEQRSTQPSREASQVR